MVISTWRGCTRPCCQCRSEKRLLNEINHSKDPEQLRYHVMASKEGNKVKERISLPAEKLFILVSRDGPCQHKQAVGACRVLVSEHGRILLNHPSLLWACIINIPQSQAS